MVGTIVELNFSGRTVPARRGAVSDGSPRIAVGCRRARGRWFRLGWNSSRFELCGRDRSGEEGCIAPIVRQAP